MMPFAPIKNGTVNIAASASSQAVAIVSESAGLAQIRIMNNGTATVWVAFGDSTVVADATKNVPIGPGVVEVLSFAIPATGTLYAAAIAAGATGNIYFTPGSGI